MGSGAIARATGDGWRGQINYDESCPTGMGPRLWEELRRTGGNTKQFFAQCIDAHPAGWIWFPRCLCHSDGQLRVSRVEPSFAVEDSDGFRSSASIQWAYVFSDTHLTVLVRTLSSPEDFVVSGQFALTSPDPDWWSLSGCPSCHSPAAQRRRRVAKSGAAQVRIPSNALVRTLSPVLQAERQERASVMTP